VTIALAIFGTNLGMALFRSPTIAYLGDLFEPAQRSKANGVINLMGGVGGALALFGGGMLYKMNVSLPFIVGAGVMIVAIVIVITLVREPELPDEPAVQDLQPGVLANVRTVLTSRDRSGLLLLLAILFWFIGWNAMEAFFTLYARNILGIDVGTGTQMLTAFAATLIIFAIPSGLIATKVGRKPTIMVGLAGMIVGVSAGYFMHNPTVILVILAIMGGFWALVNINSLPMVYDLAGKGSIGAYTGLYYFSSSLAAITGPILAGRLVDMVGYRSLWPFTAVFLALALIMMSQVRAQRPAAGES
jgi:MFS family permease